MIQPIRRLALDRRTVLKGSGACLALPLLDAMQPGLAAPARPVRTVFVFAPNGKKMDDWTPASTGSAYEAPFLLEPVQRHRRDVLVLSGLALDGARSHGDGPGDHARSAASFLTCAHPRKTGGSDIHVGVSVDQVLAARDRGRYPFASLELGMEPGRSSGSCDSGYSCAYSNNISWRAPDMPVAKEVDPRAVFERLFGAIDARRDREREARDRRRRRSLLDFVREDAAALRRQLGAEDRAKLDQYLTSVREVEERIARAEAQREGDPAVDPPEGLSGQKVAYREGVDLMYRLIVLALQAEKTRVVSFMLGNAGSNRSYRWIDVPDGHHQISHHGGDAAKLAMIRRINRWHLERFAGFLDALAEADDGGAPLLAHAGVVYGSAIGDGNRHNHHDLPALLAGGAGGQVSGGRHLAFAKNTPMANLYLRMLGWMGCGDERFGDSTAALDLVG